MIAIQRLLKMYFVSILAIIVAAVSLLSLSACSTKASFGAKPGEQQFDTIASYNTEVDVLFVVDNSNSMAPRQRALANQAEKLVEALNRTGLDYRIAVTTTDMDSGLRGAFSAQDGTSAVLDKKTFNLANLLGGRLLQGDQGSRVEQGLAAIYAALTDPSLARTNQGFLRQNALLSVVVLSDEEDMSPSRNYAAALDKIKPKLPSGSQSWIVNYFGIVATDTNCMTNPEYQFFSPGIKYMELAKASGGIIESICKSDLSSSVASLHARLLEVMTEYLLTGTPKIASIQVLIDGVKVDKNDFNGWSYDSVRNSVIFRGTATPKPTSKIKVLYDLEKL